MLRKADLGIEGTLGSEWLSYNVTASGETNDDGKLVLGLEYAYLRARPVYKSFEGKAFVPMHGFTLGAMKIPFSRQSQTGDTKLQFVRRSMAAEEMPIAKDLGATLDARYDIGRGVAVLDLRGGAFNGQGQEVYAADNNDNLMYVARGRLDLLSPMSEGEGDPRASFLSEEGKTEQFSMKGPQLSVGGSFLQNNDIDRIVKAWGVDAEARWMGLALQYEYIKTSFEPDYAENIVDDTIASKWETDGWYAQGGFFIWPRRVEFAARYEEYRTDLLSDNMDERLLANTTYGLNVHFLDKHRLKFMADYTTRAEIKGLPVLDNDSVTVQACAAF